MKPTLTPYLNFNGQTAQAMKFYQSVLGGELKMQTFGDSGMPTKPEYKDRIIHADLKNDLLSFMASDGDDQHPIHMGDNIHMSIVGIDEADAARGRVSWISPIAKALLRRQPGDIVKLATPGGVEEIEVVDVRYEPLD